MKTSCFFRASIIIIVIAIISNFNLYSQKTQNRGSFAVSGRSSSKIPGEPVPGAEIYVELENKSKIAGNHTDGKGIASSAITLKGDFWKGKSPSSEKNGNFFVKIPDKFFKEFSAKHNNEYQTGTFNFIMKITIGTKKIEKKFSLTIASVKDFGQPITRTSGPFSESLSNIEDGSAMSAQLILESITP